MLKKAHTILNDVFGYKTFRPLQEKIIQSILHKKDALVIMPTGGGKSLCYQIPALIFEGLTIVVSPLISLMKDQVEQLYQLGIGAIFLNSSLNAEEYKNNIELLLNGKVKLLYVAPETLFMDKTIRLLDSIKVDCITVDEAHCISEWGHDFRPEYRKLAEVRTHFPETVCIAFTATATPRVQQDIIQSLKLKNSAEFIASFNRENLYLEIIPKTGGVDQTIKFLRKYPNQSGIIYCFSRKQVDSLYNDLLHAGYSVLPYHAGLKDEERKNNQELFIRDDVQIIVATIAFGMGINKSNVRFVIHFDLPKNIESYYQEIGRAGRDGLRSHCLLLFSYADILKIRYFINQKESKEKRIAEDHLSAMLDYAETGVCRRVPMLSYFGEKTNIKKCGMCDNCNSNEKDLVDVTIPAQKFLSCVKRTNEIFGASYIVDVLRGSKSDKVLNNGHDKLSTYNIGSEYTKKQWMYLSHQLIHNQLLESDPAYGGLRLAPKAYELLKGNFTLTAKIIDDFSKSADKELTGSYDHLLFAALRVKRKEIADQLRLPPYVIFSDKTITEMSTFFPTNKVEMMRIHGMGQIKFEKYGEIFLNEIISYCITHNVKPNGKVLTQEHKKTIPLKTKSFKSSGEKFNSGMSIREISNETKFRRSTILKHLLDFLETEKINEPERLLEESFLSEEDIDLVVSTFMDLGAEKLEPVFKQLKGKINYDELHLLRIYFKALNSINR